MELIHNFSLVHDDIQDSSYKRHHRPALWKVWGESQAINAGEKQGRYQKNSQEMLHSASHPLLKPILITLGQPANIPRGGVRAI